MNPERSSVFEELAKAKERKVEEKTSSLNGAAVEIADMVEGNTVLQQRAETEKQKQGYQNSPFHHEMASYGREFSDLRQQDLDLTKLIPEKKQEVQGLQELYKDDPESIADLVQRAERAIRELEEELGQIPAKEQKISEKCDARRALDADFRQAYADIETENNGRGIRFAVETTLKQTEQAGKPLKLNQSALEQAVSHELYIRKNQREEEAHQKSDHELEQRETPWLEEVERIFKDEQARIEELIESRAKYLRGETADGRTFIANVNSRYAQAEALQKKWTFREKTKEYNKDVAMGLGSEIDEMFRTERTTLHNIGNEIHNSWARMVSMKPDSKGQYSYSLLEYPRDGDYSFHSLELRKKMAERAGDLRTRVIAFKKEMEAKQQELLPLLESIRSPQAAR